MTRPRCPDFIGIGAFRSGTSSLDAVLRDHPRVFVWKYKETYYWNKRYRKTPLAWYKRQFAVLPNLIAGEITPSYFGQVGLGVAKRIKAGCPDAKFLLLLRDPVQTTISAYWMRRNWGKKDVKGVPLDEFARRVAAGHYPLWVKRRDYGALLEQWLEHFPLDRFWIAKSEDLWKEPGPHARRLWRFLGVPHRDVKKWPRKAHFKRHAKASDEALGRLRATFRPMEARLKAILGDGFGWGID